MFASAALSNSTSMSEEGSASSETRAHDFNSLISFLTPTSPSQHLQQSQAKGKKKRSQPGNPDPDAEVVALSPKTLIATNRFVCEICNKGFQRDQNLQLHRRGHNLPWKLRQRSSKEGVRKRVYVCPEPSCVHHHPSRALGDLTGIKKHFSRKHGEKKWKCDKCSKRYAVHSDWKAHVKTCGTREYRCDCGTLFSRKDSFVTHKAFCDALAEESAKLLTTSSSSSTTAITTNPLILDHPFFPFSSLDPTIFTNPNPNPNLNYNPHPPPLLRPYAFHLPTTAAAAAAAPHLSATSLLQRASAVGPIIAGAASCPVGCADFDAGGLATWHAGDRLTRDFLGVVAGEEAPSGVRDLLPLTCLDLVTAPHYCAQVGDHTCTNPVSEPWGNC
ncbi:Protein indeterminate-domain 12 [Ananas comosus]|uniref:Protein EARLY HEADING DATE 2 n=1 Tax=Ananas comosus TaxID=4615 RepID=A0A199VH21_ANACO|nr:Protein indeterminate-domain 12 [Ananas comosus]